MISTYAGSYSGSFAGGITGTLSMEVTKLGTAKVILNPSAGISENFQGNITKYGDFEGVTSPTGFQILGSLNQFNSSYSGTWKKGNLSGSWAPKNAITSFGYEMKLLKYKGYKPVNFSTSEWENAKLIINQVFK